MKVEEVLRGSFSDWLNDLKVRLKLSIGYAEPFLDELNEAMQRRNLLVHNGGEANTVYMARVPERLRKSVEIGDELFVSQEYLERCIRTFERVFLLIGAELWKKLAPKDEKRSSVLFDIS
jgi:hypothetical protein